MSTTTGSTTQFANQAEVAALADNVADKRESEQAELESLDATRQSLETDRSAPEPDVETDGAGEDDAEPEYLDADDVVETLEDDDAELDLEALAEPLEMNDERIVGYDTLHVDGDEVRVGNANVFGADELEDRLDAIDTPGVPQRTLREYLVNTLAEWAVDDTLDREYWARNHSPNELLTLYNALLMGGNSRLR